jgi:hypothetical protein
MFNLNNISTRDAKISFLAALGGVVFSLTVAAGYVYTIKSAHVAELDKCETQISKIYDREYRPTAVVAEPRNWVELKNNSASYSWSGRASATSSSTESSKRFGFSSRPTSSVKHNKPADYR